MVRHNIFEIINKRYNIIEEMNKITKLFYSDLFEANSYHKFNREKYSIEYIFEEYVLNNWKQRGTCVSCNEIRNKLGFEKESYFFENKDENIPIEFFITILEYYINLIYLLDCKYNITRSCYNVSDKYIILKQNIFMLIEKLNHEAKTFTKEEKIILIPKNPEATSVAEISSEDTAIAILMYNHHSMKGDLEGKRKLLYQMALEYEPILKSPKEGYSDFYNKTTGLLNNLNIRHNNKSKENNKNDIIELNESELEKWYDELYQLLLFCVLIKDNLERKNRVDEFLKSLKNKDKK